MSKKFVAIGPESTGKSMLCEQLAAHYNTVWCPEYARSYLLEHGKEYNYDDLLLIARGQVAMEEKLGKNIPENGLYFIDTDMYVMKVWCEFVFERCHRFILDQITSRHYDHYFLCNVDLPWVKDELREYPDLKTREILFRIYKDILVNQDVPWTLISGNYDQRLQLAIETVEAFR